MRKGVRMGKRSRKASRICAKTRHDKRRVCKRSDRDSSEEAKRKGEESRKSSRKRSKTPPTDSCKLLMWLWLWCEDDYANTLPASWAVLCGMFGRDLILQQRG